MSDGEHGNLCRAIYLLLRLGTGTRPFRYDILLRLRVRSKGKCDARKRSSLCHASAEPETDVAQCAYKIYAHDQLGFASARTLDLDRRASSILTERRLRRSSVHASCPLVAAGVLWWLWSAAQRRMSLSVGTGVDGGRVMRHRLLGSRRHRTRGSGSVGVVGVAGRASQRVLHAG